MSDRSSSLTVVFTDPIDVDSEAMVSLRALLSHLPYVAAVEIGGVDFAEDLGAIRERARLTDEILGVLRHAAGA